ncbi:LysM peptidoglycan-binding domain-containing M23 family metallopeptidase [Pseudooceanicola onchidii]|uniref:LysM peptidoglycan-binding domain-containing M23 family metallopeptidase n=1 Tax=Pseudooceanicola onchidii TaxID=2562279 RepID=UPI001F106B58|nr:LysM peptidoglycan-binding domain-containing M23 family metallopeptidase [Pseudooceanicola onchidii]
MRAMLAGTALVALAACQNGFDMDVRGELGGFSTTDAARTATVARPAPDDRGVISYPNYQVAVSRRGDSVAQVAGRVGVDPQQLADYNGLRTDDILRNGEILALPSRVAEPSPATGAPGTGPYMPAGQVDIGSMAGAALDRAGDQRVEVSTLPAAQSQLTAPEPVRHKVARGETAYTISRLYDVSVRSLADWNGLDENYTIREGQFLLIPVAVEDVPVPVATQPPGVGSPTPVPPSASAPLPAEQTQPITPPERTASSTAAPAPAPAPAPTAAPDLGQTQTAAPKAAMDYPVKGRIIRDYSKGKSDGIDIAADSGTAVRAAQGGTVAAITSDADNVRVIVVRHEGKLLTIYSNVDNIAVKEGMSVSRGQKLAEVRKGSSPYVHFEVRKGLEATDPMDYLQ